jgi:phosphatidylglycerol:prolipoprotein diacylglycerol transferase
VHAPAPWQASWPAFPIYSYGLMFGLSLFVGWHVTLRLTDDDGLPSDQMGTCLIVAAIGSVVVARLLYVVTQPEELQGGLLDMLNTRRGGMVAYGGLIGSALGSYVYCRLRRLPLLLWADAAIVAVSLGTGVTRIGCLLYGCDYGRPAPALPFGIRFPRGSQAHTDHVQRKIIDATAAWSERVHPTQIYESLIGLACFLFLLWVRRRRQFAGQVFLAWVFSYGTLRYAVENYRGDEDRAFVGPFSTSQLIAIVTMSVAGVLYYWLYRRYQADPAGSRPWEALRAAAAAAAKGASAPAGAGTSSSGGSTTGAEGGSGRGGRRRRR